jgi:DNA-binding XRE family transcriptional regulator
LYQVLQVKATVSRYLSTGSVLYYVMKPVSVNHVKFGERIKDLRGDLGMTQEMLAAKVGLDRSYMGFLERGERNPSLEVIIKIAKALEIKPDELLKEIK